MTPVAADTIASASVKVNGAPLDQGLMDFVEKIEVRTAVGLPDMATVRLGDPEGVMVGNADSTKTGLPAKPPFEIADEIEISLGDPVAHQPVIVFKGEVVALETEFDTSAATIAVRAYDRSHRLQRGRKSRTFLGQTSSDVVRSVVADAGITQSDIETTTTVHDFLQQSMESDWDLCQRLAASENMEFGYDSTGNKAFLRKERKAQGATPEIKWRENLLSFKPRLTTVQQPTRVVVRSYDPATKQELVGTATSANGLPPALAAQRDKAKKFGEAELLVSDRVANTQGEVQQIAQGTMDHLASGFFEADGVTTGNPHLRAGGKVKIAEVGRFNGEYSLTSVVQSYGHGNFKSRFVISGRHSRTLTEVMRPKEDRDWGGKLVVGLVTNLNDPESLGRVKVKLPALGDTMESTWARVATPHAGAERGLSILPMIGDEVVVAFEHGDTRRAIVLGALHNAKDKPHEAMRGNQEGGSLVFVGVKDADVQLTKQFTIACKEQMTIDVKRASDGKDVKNSKGEFLLTAEGKIQVTGDAEIEISSRGAMTIKSTAALNVEATGAMKIKGSSSVDVEAGAQLKLKGNAGVDIESSGVVNVRGTMINIG
jgi:uncharacterized protein involved in type VI secretion and phage assembly